MKVVFMVASAGFCVLASSALAQPAPAPSRVDRLVGEMTLTEKVAQLNQLTAGEPQDPDTATREKALSELLAKVRSGAAGTFLGGCGAEHTSRLQTEVLSNSRLNVPALFAHDVIHGYRTIFPTPLAESCSWDLDLAERTAAAAAREARAAGVRWTFAPMVDIARDPRWGRIVEGAGEDPFLGSQMAVARVRGFQGPGFDLTKRLADDRVLACAKHFAAYGAAEGGRDYNTADISPITLQQVYLPPFRAAVGAKVASFMTAFNEINGVPCTASRELLVDTLRTQWAFDGAVVTDYTSIMELTKHRFARDARHAAQLSIEAQVDIDMVSEHFASQLPGLVERGTVPVSSIDRAVRRVLRLKEAAGLFENPMTDVSAESNILLAPEHRALAREAAAKSIVLLKNDRDILPLKRLNSAAIDTPPVLRKANVAVIGPLADSGRDAIGTWACTGRGEEAVTPLAGIRSLAEELNITVSFAAGCKPLESDDRLLEEASKVCDDSDLIIAVIGEPEQLSGEAHSRSLIELPLAQQSLLDALSHTDKPMILVLMTGRPIIIPAWLQTHASAILLAWHGGSEAGSGLADVLSGKVNPSARLTTSFPRTAGQIPIHYNHKPTGRPNNPKDRYTTGYIDTEISPLYPFGYGLSYTSFTLSSPKLSTDTLKLGDTLTAEVQVQNTGSRSGTEVVQWYASVPYCSVTRPVKELVGFSRVELAPGKTKTVRVRIPATQLGYLDAKGALVFESTTAELTASGGSTSAQPVAVRLVAESPNR